MPYNGQRVWSHWGKPSGRPLPWAAGPKHSVTGSQGESAWGKAGHFQLCPPSGVKAMPESRFPETRRVTSHWVGNTPKRSFRNQRARGASFSVPATSRGSSAHSLGLRPSRGCLSTEACRSGGDGSMHPAPSRAVNSAQRPGA